MKIIQTCLVGLFLLTLSTSSSFSQSTTISDFSIESPDFKIDDESMEIASVLSKSGSILIWTQNYGSNSSSIEFTIENVSGSWDTSSSTGNISMILSLNGATGLLVLSGTGTVISAQMQTTGLNNATEELDFEVSGIVYQ